MHDSDSNALIVLNASQLCATDCYLMFVLSAAEPSGGSSVWRCADQTV